MNKILAILFVCGAAHALHAQGVRGNPTPPATLQPGATLQIRVSGVPAEESNQMSSQLFTVAADGIVNLPYIGPVAVTGLTLRQAERAIEREYVAQKIYRFPTIFIQYRPSGFDPQRIPYPSHDPGPLDAPGPGYRTHIRPLHVAHSQ
jgi:hypothetical protein